MAPAVQSKQLPAMEAVEFIEGRLNEWSNFIVVCESFVPRPGVRTWQPDALEVIGAIRYACYKYGHPFELQTPAQAKQFATDAKLRKIGWHRSTEGGHENDARRHLLLGMVRHNAIDLEPFLD